MRLLSECEQSYGTYYGSIVCFYCLFPFVLFLRFCFLWFCFLGVLFPLVLFPWQDGSGLHGGLAALMVLSALLLTQLEVGGCGRALSWMEGLGGWFGVSGVGAGAHSEPPGRPARFPQIGLSLFVCVCVCVCVCV